MRTSTKSRKSHHHARIKSSRKRTICGIPIADGVLYTFFGLLLNSIIAGAAMSMSSASVITNALRLRNMKM